MTRLSRDTALRSIATAVKTIRPGGVVDVRRPRNIPPGAGLVVKISVVAPAGAAAKPAAGPVEIETSAPAEPAEIAGESSVGAESVESPGDVDAAEISADSGAGEPEPDADE